LDRHLCAHSLVPTCVLEGIMTTVAAGEGREWVGAPIWNQSLRVKNCDWRNPTNLRCCLSPSLQVLFSRPPPPPEGFLPRFRPLPPTPLPVPPPTGQGEGAPGRRLWWRQRGAGAWRPGTPGGRAGGRTPAPPPARGGTGGSPTRRRQAGPMAPVAEG